VSETADDDFIRTAGASQLLARLRAIEGVLSGQASVASYTDTREASLPLAGSEPVVLQTAELSPAQHTVYCVGLALQDLLVQRCQHARVIVLAARSLPVHPPYAANAYCNSVYFHAASNTLFVRCERLAAVGEYALVLTHALAHVHTGSLDSDADPAFLAEFHRCLRVLCEDALGAKPE